jgi:hypothetical protein
MIDDKVLNAYEYFHASSAFSAFLIDNEFNRTDASFLDQYDKELYVKCPRCGWQTKATHWEIDFHDDGTIYTIVVCPKCYSHLYLIEI